MNVTIQTNKQDENEYSILHSSCFFFVISVVLVSFFCGGGGWGKGVFSKCLAGIQVYIFHPIFLSFITILIESRILLNPTLGDVVIIHISTKIETAVFKIIICSVY